VRSSAATATTGAGTRKREDAEEGDCRRALALPFQLVSAAGLPGAPIPADLVLLRCDGLFRIRLVVRRKAVRVRRRKVVSLTFRRLSSVVFGHRVNSRLIE
jgi:hypothetical protein